MEIYLNKYKKAIRALPSDTELTKQDLLVDDFLLAREGKLETYYAPHNEFINRRAKVVIVGLTPGWTQMRVAFQAAKRALDEGLSDEEVGKRAKESASFAGSMRVNLVSMLQALGLHQLLDIPSCESLFAEHRSLLHTTSVLRFPVFVGGRNYSGSQPNLLTTASLRESAVAHMSRELGSFERILVIPLGKTVEGVLKLVVQAGNLDEWYCLWGFPHPSGANGHRHQQFAALQDEFRARLKAAL